ncbi:MAG: multidrug effflux MFS transporter [Bacteroidetes bacterium]|nr:multidrug effflux MFS transporter [Bacteroidota bacterium]
MIKQRSAKENFFLVLILGILNTITPISIDMYLPAFPGIAADLHTTINNIALSVSTYFLGFSLGQIVYGPLLDRFGRKRPLYIGLSLYILASIACASAQTISMLLIVRFMQALSGCVAAVAAMAMVRDFFPVDKSARIISLLVLILGVSPLLAPTAGGLITGLLGWRWIFIILAIIVFIVLVVVIFFLPEGHTADRSISLKPKPIINGFIEILNKKQFLIFSLAGTFSFAGLFVYVAGSPAIFMDSFHVSAKVYGGIFALLSVGFISCSQLNHIFTLRFSSEQIFKTTLIIQSITGLFYFIGVLNNWYGLTGNILFLFIQLSCTGLTYPNAAAVAMAPFTKNAGSASALLGFIQIGIGGILSSGVGMMRMKGSLPTALIMAVSSTIALLIFLTGNVKISDEMREEIKLAGKNEMI